MTSLDSFSQRLNLALSQSERKRAEHEGHVRQRMNEISRRSDQFNEAATVLLATIVRPRVQLLAEKFENARISDSAVVVGHACTCVFDRNSRFPASTSLELALIPNDPIDQIIVSYHLEILPVFLEYRGRDQLAQPLNKVDEATVCRWIEDHLGEFVDTYLQLETAKAYQDENMETDPVCGMPVNRNWAAATAEHSGKTYYFCIDECRQRFEKQPHLFIKELA